MERGLSVMGDCQFSYTGLQVVQDEGSIPTPVYSPILFSVGVFAVRKSIHAVLFDILTI